MSREKIEQDKKTLENFRNFLDTKRVLLERLRMQQELYSCPCCQTKLRFTENELHLATDILSDDEKYDIDQISQEMINIKLNIKNFESVVFEEENKLKRQKDIQKEIQACLCEYDEVPDLHSLRDDLEYLEEYKNIQYELEKRLNKLEKRLKNEKFSSSYISFKKSVERQVTEISKLRENKALNTNEELSEQKLRSIIQKQKSNKDKLEDLKIRILHMIETKETHTQQLKNDSEKYLKKYKEDIDQDTLQIRITKEEENIIRLEQKQKDHEKNLATIEKYLRYKSELENYNNWKNKVIKLKSEEKRDRDLYASASLLKEKILEAESIAVLNIINSINTHAQLYLDAFFPDDPIIVRLLPFKETKKSKKPQINVVVDYKGMECDLNMLSGGELSRVILAFTLALGEMFNTPILMLDESTSSLDQELTSVVFNSIREHFTGKMVLVIAHQGTEGIYDKVIKI